MDIKLQHSTNKKSFYTGILLLVLAILDCLITDFGLRNNHITEANPLMRIVYGNSVPAFYAIKIVLPLLLLYIMTKFEPRRYLQLLIAGTLFLYAFVLVQHIYWLSLL